MNQASPETDYTWWPSPYSPGLPAGVVAVSTNFNTRLLIAQLLWSLHHFLGNQLRSVVIVDNGSTDGSTRLLQAAAEARLCELIANPHNRQHGPALSQALSHLASTRPAAQAERPWIWLLDSDCLIARPDAAEKAVASAVEAGAALVGEAYWNEWHAEYRFLGCSLLLDPARAWRAEVGAFEQGGDPVGEFERACRSFGLPAGSFPFTRDGYIIHLGRGTLAGVQARQERSHPLYEWAQAHHEPHFQEVPGAPARYATLLEAFNRQVPELSADLLIRACQERNTYS